jgi:hypothetical protein
MNHPIKHLSIIFSHVGTLILQRILLTCADDAAMYFLRLALSGICFPSRPVRIG